MLLISAAANGRAVQLADLLADPSCDPNKSVQQGGCTALVAAASEGSIACVALLLADRFVTTAHVNQPNNGGLTPLSAAVYNNHPRCVRQLLADPRVDVNAASATSPGRSALWWAARLNHSAALEVLIRDERVAVHAPSCTDETSTPLLAACNGCEASGRHRSPGDAGVAAGHCFVLLLKSRRIPHRQLRHAVHVMRRFLPADQHERNWEAGGWRDGTSEPGPHILTPTEQAACIVVPILEAQLAGEFRWCASCLALAPQQTLNRCGGCHQVGYCEMAQPGHNPCHLEHWEAGHKQECKRFQAEAAETAKMEAETAAAGEGSEGHTQTVRRFPPRAVVACAARSGAAYRRSRRGLADTKAATGVGEVGESEKRRGRGPGHAGGPDTDTNTGGGGRYHSKHNN